MSERYLYGSDVLSAFGLKGPNTAPPALEVRAAKPRPKTRPKTAAPTPPAEELDPFASAEDDPFEGAAEEEDDPFADADGGDDWGSSGGGDGGFGMPSGAAEPPSLDPTSTAIAPDSPKGAKNVQADRPPPIRAPLQVEKTPWTPPPAPKSRTETASRVTATPSTTTSVTAAPKPPTSSPAPAPITAVKTTAPAGTTTQMKRTAVRGGAALESPIPGVSDEAWTRFAVSVRSGKVGAVSPSNALGMFEMKPRRLADLGLVENTAMTRSPSGRMIWVGDFAPPMTARDFLRDPVFQYKVFCDSMRDYHSRMRAGNVETPEGGRPQGMTVSGALAVLHRSGPHGLRRWNDESSRFPDTVALYERANGIF